MPTIKIDGKEIPFEKGDTIIRAAWKQGIEIPHYCWHPGLSVAANCRMCLVEIEATATRRQVMLDVVHWDEASKAYVQEKKAKLEPACQVECADGMSIKSESSPNVINTRKHVQELLLLNHPVDCPICDQAGECKLQDYWLQSQHTPKRMHDEINHKPKAVNFSDSIVYDAERCIVCTRCVRFMEEVAKDPVLSLRERGNLSEVVLSADRQVEGHYTMMLDHVCPVGALTTRDFRFKARVWFLKQAKSVCIGCATGCNTIMDYDHRTGDVPRLRPRDNEAVNKFWMCDDGILTHRHVTQNRVADHANGGIKATLEAAMKQAKALVDAAGSKVAFVLSAQRCTEDNFALAALAKQLKCDAVYLARSVDWQGDSILRDADHNPNVRGAIRAYGSEPKPLDQLATSIESGDVTFVIALSGALDLGVVNPAFSKAKWIVLSDQKSPVTELAAVTIAIASWAEQSGSFVNRQNLEQGFEAGPVPRGDSLAGYHAVSKLAAILGHDLGLNTYKSVRMTLKQQTPLPAPVHTEQTG